jgi:hypothetical protein
MKRLSDSIGKLFAVVLQVEWGWWPIRMLLTECERMVGRKTGSALKNPPELKLKCE